MDEFTKSYIICALWSCNKPNGDNYEEYDIEDIEAESLEGIIQDCTAFQEENIELLVGLDMSKCGHDFCLTRNHHGSGFWDRGLGEIGQNLTQSAEKYNEFDLLEENGKIFVE